MRGAAERGTDDVMAALRAREFGRLDASEHVYLDYTGSGLYPESHVRRHAELLLRGVFGNPHSHSVASRASTERVEAARERVRRFFRADATEYEVIFTPNASGALKLVGEGYPFEAGSRLVLTADNHNSVNGLREFARRRGAEVGYVPLERGLVSADVVPYLTPVEAGGPNLFAYPAQSNFSGVKHPLEWIELARDRGYDVILDAAAYVPTNPLDLTAVNPDYVCVSFYKMFGYPTGVGALIARRAALAKLERPWFAGGTVRFVSAQNQLHVLEPTGEAFEDGTLDFLSIAAVPGGLDLLEQVGMTRLQRHVQELAGLLLRQLGELRHGNGSPLVRIYGPETAEGRGGTVAFNLLDPSGALVDCEDVERRAAAAGISLRTGCFCNPGAAEYAFEFGAVEAYRCFEALSPREFTLQQFSSCMDGKAAGAVRVSLGLASNRRDVSRLIEFLRRYTDADAPLPSRRLPEVVAG